MKAWTPCRGLICATFTPMHQDGSLNLDAIKPYAEYLKSKGIHQVYVNGTAGEHASLSVEERKAVAEAWVKHGSPAMTRIILHCGMGNLADSKELAAHAEAIGADAVAAVAPTYFQPQSLGDLIEYIAAIAAAAPNTPFMYYHIPVMTRLSDRTIDLFRALGERIPNFIGVKHTSNDFYDAQLAREFRDGKWDVVVGCETMLLGALAMGLDASIGVTYTLLPRTCGRLYEAFHRGDLEAARREQAYIQRLWEALHRPGNVSRMVSAFKAAASLVQPGLNFGPPRMPVSTVTAEEEARIQAAFLELKVAEHEK